MPSSRKWAQRGTSMIEVLVTIVIIAFGLLGMAGLQSRMQVSEVESYQRAQALVLLNDMANRIATNRTSAATYVGGPIGAGEDCAADYAGTTIPLIDKREWCNGLQGAAEVQGSSRLGAVIGGRGCVQNLGNGEFLVTVAWQGLVPLSAPPDSVPCGQNLYDGGGSCASDMCRRAVTTIVKIASLL